MAKPFLDPQSEQYLDYRFEEVASAVEAYLDYRDKNTTEFTEKPEPLEELEHLEYMNWQHLPLAGGLYDQPFFFMHDIWAAIAAKNKYEAEKHEKDIESEMLFGETPGKVDLNKYFSISE